MVGELIVGMALLSLLCVSGASVEGKVGDKVACIPYKYGSRIENKCVVWDYLANINYVQPCNAGYTCEKEVSEFYCYPEQASIYFHGEACSSDSECYSNTCTNKKCVGVQAGATCSADLECANDLYCDLASETSTCTALIGVGQACLRDAQCRYGSYCNKAPGATAGVCTAYFSLASGTAVDICRDLYFDYQCASSFCVETQVEENKYTYECTQIYSHSKSRIECDEDDDCEGFNADKSSSMNSKCTCGYSQNGKAFCKLLPGDDEYAQYTSLLKEWYATNLEQNCNTVRRDGLDCVKTYWTEDKVYALEYYALKTKLWTQILDVQSEVGAVLNADYWEAKETYEINLPVECNAYKCKKSSQDFDDTTCAYYDEESTTYYLKECAYNGVCSGSSGQNLTCQSIASERAYPGESCKYNMDCTSGVCTDGICDGTDLGVECYRDEVCDPGYYCDYGNTGKCVYTLNIGSICTNDWQCGTGSFCKFDILTQVGKCAEYFSAATGDKVSSCVTDGVDYECETGYCVSEYDESTDTTTHTCTEVFKLDDDVDESCEKDKDCLGYNSDKSLSTYSECLCGYSEDREGTCKLLPGDSSYKKYIQYFKDWLAYRGYCNTTRRFSLGCAESHWDREKYLTLAYYQYKTLYWHRINNISSCAKKVFMKDYYDLEDDYEDETDDSAFSLAFAAFLAFLVLA